MLLSTVKLYLGFNDTLQDALIQQIIEDVTQRVNNYVGETSLPTELEWIVKELTIIRYNRIGSEGFKSETEEGKSLSLRDDPFLDFVPELDKYLESKNQPAGRGRVKFL